MNLFITLSKTSKSNLPRYVMRRAALVLLLAAAGVTTQRAPAGEDAAPEAAAQRAHRALDDDTRPPKGSWKKKKLAAPEHKPGVPWTAADREGWSATRVEQRSYADDVLMEMHLLRERFRGRFMVGQYGELAIDANKYPLYMARSQEWVPGRPSVLITGGVHGYEKSGVHGALQFLREDIIKYHELFNFLIVPCVSPWGYEYIQRWNDEAVDPNRSFDPNPLEGASVSEYGSEEAEYLMKLVRAVGRGGEWAVHIDLHETTNTDETEFMPAKAARDGELYKPGQIPDGFYVVGDSDAPTMDWYAAIIAAVKQVTHIAPADHKGEIIGAPMVAEGVILYAARQMGLCAGLTGAKYSVTTEVYPDSSKVTEEDCNRAQVAAITGALNYVLREEGRCVPGDAAAVEAAQDGFRGVAPSRPGHE